MASEDRERQEKRRPLELFGEVVLDDPEPIQQFSPRTPEEETRGQEVAGDITPAVRESSRQQVERRREQQESAPGLAEGWDMARDAEWIGNLVAQNRQFSPDPDFEMSPEKLLEVTEGLPEDAIDYVAESQSEDEMKSRAQRYRKDYEVEQGLAQMGFTGTALRIGAAGSDPVVWGASLGASAVTGPLGLVGTAAKRISRIQRIVRGGMAGAAGNLAVESAIKANKPIYDDINMLYAAGLGFGIGGGLSALSRNPSTQPEAEAFRRGGEALKRRSEAEAREVTEQVGRGSTDTGAEGTRRAEPLSPEDSNLELWVEKADRNEELAPRTAFGRTGGLTSSTVRLMNSRNPVSRAGGHVFGENAIGTADRSIVSKTPSTQMQIQTQRAMEGRWMRGFKTNFREFRKEMGNGSWRPLQRGEDERQFNHMMADYIEGLTDDVPASVKAQGDLFRELFEEYRVNLNQPGAARGEYLRAPEGFGLVEKDPYYFPHMPNYEAFNSRTREFGSGQVEALFARAAKEASEEMSEEVAQRVGRGYVRILRKIRAGLGRDAGRILATGDAEEIKKLLKENNPNTPDAEIEDMIDDITADKSSKGTGPRHGKSRTPLNMNQSMYMKRGPSSPVGMSGGREVSIKEFFERDAHSVFLSYNRRMSGSLAMARTRVPGLFDGITNASEFETLKRKAREAGDMVGQPTKEINDDIAQLDYLYKSVMGIPQMGQDHAMAQFIRRVRDFQFARVMGQVGFSQFPEVGQAATGVGLKAALKSVPSFKAMWRDAKTGEIKDELVDELEMATSEGSDWLRTLHIDRFDEMTGSMDTTLGHRFGAAYDSTIRKANRMVSAGSGMAAINTFSQRFALAGIANRFDQMARGGKGWTPQRLRAMGLSDDDVSKILESIRTHAEHKQGLTGKKLKKLNLDQWDAEVKSTFEDTLFRYSRRLVQQNDPGQFRPIMSNPVAQMILQFRTFIIGAHTKGLLHNIHMRDFQTFSTFAVSSAFGALGYISRERLGAAFSDEDEADLDERLSMENVAKAAFERSSWAALLPMGMDTGLTLGGFTPMFDYRSTAQPTDIALGSASIDNVRSISDLMGAVTQPVTEGRLPSQDEVESGLRALPFHNVNGVVQMTNLLLGESGLPEDAPR